MKENLYNYFFTLWEGNFFTEPLLILAQIFLLIYFLKIENKNPLLKPFALYVLAGLILFIGVPISRFYLESQKKALIIISEGLNMFFALIEIFTFGFFYSQVLKSKWVSKFISAFIILFSIVYISLLTHISVSNYSLLEASYIIDKFTFIELLTIGILSSCYFFELFKFYTHSNLLKDPAFWISSCSILYSLIFPINLILFDYMRIQKHPHFHIFISLHYISLLIIYAGILKALLCTKLQNK